VGTADPPPSNPALFLLPPHPARYLDDSFAERKRASPVCSSYSPDTAWAAFVPPLPVPETGLHKISFLSCFLIGSYVSSVNPLTLGSLQDSQVVRLSKLRLRCVYLADVSKGMRIDFSYSLDLRLFVPREVAEQARPGLTCVVFFFFFVVLDVHVPPRRGCDFRDDVFLDFVF